MPFSAAAIANEFLELAWQQDKSITPLKMQKLVYFAHGWYLALFSEPLIGEAIQAWKYGPVIGSLYRLLKQYGNGAIRESIRVITQEGDQPARIRQEGLSATEIANARAVVARVWEQYGKFTASQLTTLTHSPDSPWSQTPNKERLERPIPNTRITEYFRHQL